MKRILYVVGFFVFLVSGTAGATNYYVKNGGNDNLNGISHDNAWKTIKKVNTEIADGTFHYGDQVLFYKGDTWTLAADAYLNIEGTIGGSGSTSNRLRFASYGSGTDPIIQRASGSGTIIRVLEDYIEIDGLHLKRGSLYGWSMGYSLIENCSIEGGFRGIWLHEYCGHNEIRNNTIDAKEMTYNYESYDGIQVGYSSDVREASTVANAYNLIHNNVVKDFRHGEIMVYNCDYNEVYNNYLYDNAHADGAGSGFVFNCGRYNKAYNNWIESPEYVRIGGQHNEVYNNVFIMIYDAINNEPVHCILTINPNIGHPGNVSYNKFYHNVFYNAFEDYPHATSSAVIYIYGKEDYPYQITNNEFSNNILLEWDLIEGHATDYAIYIASKGDNVSGNIFKNNAIYKTSGVAGSIIYDDTSAYTVSGWNDADPNGNTIDGNIAVDPGLEDPANGQFWPSSESSNVVDAGATGYTLFGLSSSSRWTPSISIVENSRVKDNSLPDIGPYEWTDSIPYKKSGELRIIKTKP